MVDIMGLVDSSLHSLNATFVLSPHLGVHNILGSIIERGLLYDEVQLVFEFENTAQSRFFSPFIGGNNNLRYTDRLHVLGLETLERRRLLYY